MKNLRPFFCFYGGKWRAAPKYPKPICDTIIEPFAGSAGYSVRYYNKNIILYDVDPIICGIWDYLIKSSPEEIMNLPAEIDHVNNLKVCQEAKWLIGFWLNKGVVTPMLSPSAWMRKKIYSKGCFWGETIRERIAEQVIYIKHWKIFNRSYEEIPKYKATWFIDPPYSGPCGKLYRKRIVNFDNLANWCRTRKPQSIVCEQGEANWLPFSPFLRIKSMEGPRGKGISEELIWTNL